MHQEKIKSLRKTLELTQIEFATVVGSHHSTVARWEKGTSTPEKGNLIYLEAMSSLIYQKKEEELKKNLKKALLIGSHLACIKAMLDIFYSEEK